MLRVTQIKGIRQKIPVSQLPIQQKERQIVTAIVGDSMVKDIYGWNYLIIIKKVMIKHFSRSPTEDMMRYINLR